jgi:hypothetical protein
VLGRAQRPDELVTIADEFGDAVVDLTGQLIDRDEERHLTLPQGVEDLPFRLDDLEDALTVGYELEIRKMILEAGILTKVFEGAAHALERHTTVEQGLDHLQGDEIAEGIQPANAGAAPSLLYGRLYKTDLVPITELIPRTACETSGLKRSKSIHWHDPCDNERNKTPHTPGEEPLLYGT